MKILNLKNLFVRKSSDLGKVIDSYFEVSDKQVKSFSVSIEGMKLCMQTRLGKKTFSKFWLTLTDGKQLYLGRVYHTKRRDKYRLNDELTESAKDTFLHILLPEMISEVTKRKNFLITTRQQAQTIYSTMYLSGGRKSEHAVG